MDHTWLPLHRLHRYKHTTYSLPCSRNNFTGIPLLITTSFLIHIIGQIYIQELHLSVLVESHTILENADFEYSVRTAPLSSNNSNSFAEHIVDHVLAIFYHLMILKWTLTIMFGNKSIISSFRNKQVFMFRSYF